MWCTNSQSVACRLQLMSIPYVLGYLFMAGPTSASVLFGQSGADSVRLH